MSKAEFEASEKKLARLVARLIFEESTRECEGSAEGDTEEKGPSAEGTRPTIKKIKLECEVNT
jgi:hypothetical protein